MLLINEVGAHLRGFFETGMEGVISNRSLQ